MCRENERTHKHHIIPRYKGGTDAQENLVEVTITQHAMFHYCNYQLWGNAEDHLAWRSLSGQLNVDEIKIEVMKLGSKKALQVQKELRKNKEYRKKISTILSEAFHKSPNKERMIQKLKEMQPIALEAALSPEARKKRLESLKRIKHQQGEKNSQYGKMWITDGTKEGSYRINKDEPIPEGFYKGRVCFDIKTKGENIATYGKMWITNGVETKMIMKTDPIPDGFRRGRDITHKTPNSPQPPQPLPKPSTHS
jgi:hypothetical protein